MTLVMLVVLLRGDTFQTVQAEPDLEPPEADAGPDMLVDFVTAARFDGGNSTDDTGVDRYVWTFVHDGEEVTLWGVVAYFPFTVHGEYEVTLNVTDGAGNWDTDTVLVTVITPPGPPRSIMSIDYDGFVDISWGEAEHDGGSPVTSYIFYRGTSPDDLLAMFQTGLSPRFHRDHYVTNGVTYFYAVAAMNDVWLGPWSEVVNATPLGPPPPPQNLTVDVSDGSIILEWDPPNVTGGHAPVQGFTVYRGTSSDLVEPVANLTGEFAYVDTDVEPGTTYHYALGTYSYLGGGPISEMVNATLEEERDTREAVLTIVVLVVPWVVIAWVMVRVIRMPVRDKPDGPDD
jgi:hypothetical protein